MLVGVEGVRTGRQDSGREVLKRWLQVRSPSPLPSRTSLSRHLRPDSTSASAARLLVSLHTGLPHSWQFTALSIFTPSWFNFSFLFSVLFCRLYFDFFFFFYVYFFPRGSLLQQQQLQLNSTQYNLRFWAHAFFFISKLLKYI